MYGNSFLGNIGRSVSDFITGGDSRQYSSYDAKGGTYNTAAGYAAAPKNTYVAPKPSPQPSPSTSSSNDQQIAQMSAQLAALQNQLARAPKLPSFDILGNYSKAKTRATEDVTPLYSQKLNNFLEGQAITRTAQTKNRDLAFENSEISRTNTRADNDTTRVRTGQDLTSSLQQIAQKQGEFLTDEGTQFDEARRGLQEEIAAGGGLETGMGKQAIGKQLKDRNTNAIRQIDEFKNNESAKKLFADRTLEDLATGDVRADQKKGQDDKAVNIDFDRAMGQLANEETSFRLNNELDKALDIASRTSSYSNQGVAEFIASLAASGARPQDIALAKQVYG
jgi:hypothetical protein